MNKLLVDTQTYCTISSKLSALSSKLESLSAQLSSIDLSQEAGSTVQLTLSSIRFSLIGTSLADEIAGLAIKRVARAAKSTASEAAALRLRILSAVDMLESSEQELVAQISDLCTDASEWAQRQEGAGISKLSTTDLADNASDGKLQTFIDEFTANYGWDEILKGSNYIKTIKDLITGIRNGKSWTDLMKTGVETYTFVSQAIQTYKNYMQIGRAVGTKTALAWWAKNITGLKSLGRASTAKNPFTRFKNNLTNKTSPFNAQIKNVVNNFTGKNGVKKAVGAWGAVAVTGALNYASNLEEQANSNGTMSNARVIAETITETAVDTALTYGAGIVVGAAVTAAFGTVAAPGIVVVATTGVVVTGINAGVKALTGKTTTEWISDGILDTGKAIGNAVGNAAKSVGKWFSKLSFA